MSFFSKKYFQFFNELEKNNNKAWFDENRTAYGDDVREPFKAFVQKILNSLAKEDDTIFTNASKCIFRINRDVRFSKNKTPYKLHMSATFGRGSTTDMRPSCYLHIGANELFLGGGMYQLDKEQLAKVRQEIYYNPEEFSNAITTKAFKEMYGELQGEKNVKLTPEYKEFANEQPLIANKQFYTMTKLTQKQVLSDDFDKLVLSYFKALKPLNDFLHKSLAS